MQFGGTHFVHGSECRNVGLALGVELNGCHIAEHSDRILHGCGKYISLSDPADCSYQIIMATEIIGLSRKEREIIAYAVKFNTMEFPYYEELSRETDLDRSEYLTVAKLTAILRVANACDRSHKQKFENVKVSLKEKELIIQVDTPEDIILEMGLFAEKAAFFEEVFSIRTSIHQKKRM